MLRFFRDNTIERAVGEVLKARITEAQDEFDVSIVEIENALDAEILAAEEKAKTTRQARAEELANKVLGK